MKIIFLDPHISKGNPGKEANERRVKQTQWSMGSPSLTQFFRQSKSSVWNYNACFASCVHRPILHEY